MVSESVINLLTAIGSISVGLGSFLFTILRTRVRGPILDFVDLSIDEFWGDLGNEIEVIKDIFYTKSKGDFKEDSSNFLSFSAVLINTGDRSCYYRTTKVSASLDVPNDPSSFDPEDRSKSKTESLTSIANIDKFKRRFITIKEAEIIKNRILLPGEAIEWFEGSLTFYGNYWDHKGKCYLIILDFKISKIFRPTCRFRVIRKLPKFDIIHTKKEQIAFKH